MSDPITTDQIPFHPRDSRGRTVKEWLDEHPGEDVEDLTVEGLVLLENLACDMRARGLKLTEPDFAHIWTSDGKHKMEMQWFPRDEWWDAETEYLSASICATGIERVTWLWHGSGKSTPDRALDALAAICEPVRPDPVVAALDRITAAISAMVGHRLGATA